jgi:hypothetical protein
MAVVKSQGNLMGKQVNWLIAVARICRDNPGQNIRRDESNGIANSRGIKTTS